MHYQVTKEETHQAKVPHHIFNLNIILTHLFISYTTFEIAHGQNWPFAFIILISLAVIAYIYIRGQKAIKTQTWFVAAHWILAWRRSRVLIMSYILAFAIVGLYLLSNVLFPGGLSMNSFDAEGTSTNIGEVIAMRFAATAIFVAVLITFMQTGISVYDAGKGIIDANIAKYLPRDDSSNPELGEEENAQAKNSTDVEESSGSSKSQ